MAQVGIHLHAEIDDYHDDQYFSELRRQYYISPFSLVKSSSGDHSGRNRSLLPLGSTGQCHVVTGPDNPPPTKPKSPEPQLPVNIPGLPTVLVWSSLELVQALLVGTPTIIIARDIDVSGS
ncbi:hypothetical protein R1flu_010881 [Riccia fluitans]|uniref:Uncharacterized protein n=1 Tax=Riccia fluitans TaxID=41844 RepID=A0ABD1Z8Q2_9MARC